jgi:hypothetical protein
MRQGLNLCPYGVKDVLEVDPDTGVHFTPVGIIRDWDWIDGDSIEVTPASSP